MVPRFGTDGVRGRAHEELSNDVAFALGRAAVEVLGTELIVIGADTRESGPELAAHLIAGMNTAGGAVENLGVVPTPTVAWAASDRKAAGAMISASHNPYYDNGIKLFAPGGTKLSDAVESEIEKRYMAHIEAGRPVEGPDIQTVPSAGIDGWLDLVVGSVAPDALQGLKVVLDCANGASHKVAPEVFGRLGAKVAVLGDTPNGVNINDGVGSTHPEVLAAAVIEQGADVGLAFDGDADRLIAVDGRGTVVDGDRVIGILAADWSATGRLKGNAVVVTVMSNLGFHRAMTEAGIGVVATQVGDRYVLAALDEHGYSLGGEQSGHVICRDLASTGDGVLTGVQLLDAVVRSDRNLATLSDEVMTTVPQILENVRLPQKMDDPGAAIASDVAEVEKSFGDDGRVLVRASGTEPLLRIMVEHIDSDQARTACDRLVAAAKTALGAA